jgi:hypothetical protein
MKDEGGRKNKPVRRRAAVAALQFVLVSSFILHPSSFGWAAHPFITDDAGTQGAGNWQLELMAQRNRHEATAAGIQQSSRATLFNPVLTYGLFETVDVALGLNYLRNRVSENGVAVDDASGLSDTTLELKWRFYDADNLSFAVKPGISLPTGDENRGLGLGKTSWGINLIADYDVKPWAWFANLAYFRPRFARADAAAESREHLWRVSAGTTYAVRENVWLAGELGVRTNEARNDPLLPGKHAHYAMLGLIYSPAEKIDLDIGLRKGLNRAETDTVFLVGATFRW